MATAQVVPAAGFDMTGFIFRATIDRTGAVTGAVPSDPILAGGTLMLNGITIIVPNNSIVQMPAASFTWAQLFDPAVSRSIPFTRPNHPSGQTGLAMLDTAGGTGVPFYQPSFQARVVGNVTTDPVTGGPRYIAGLILPIEQQGFNSGSGIINFINYNNGAMRVGGIIGNPNSGALVQINDSIGRFGRVHSPDPRFKMDTDNPTVTAASGYPMGVPRFNPATQIDPLCPVTNRPLNGDPNFPTDPFLAIGAPLRTFTMPAPGPGVTPDANVMCPLMVGDWIDYSGTIYKANPNLAWSPTNILISAHSITAHLGIQTASGVAPAYFRVEDMVMGVGPFPTPVVGPAQEASSRAVMVGFSTDPTATANVFAIDVDPVTGAETEVPFPNGQNVPMDDPVRGRIRLQLNKNQPEPPGNAILSPSTGQLTYTREYIVKLSTGQVVQANGLTAGQYRFPMFGYIFPEGAVFGQPIPPYNFDQFTFLSIGNGPLNGTGPVIGRLDPFPVSN